jgi:hypothetical protein
MFGDRVAKPTVVPEALDGLTLELEGSELQIVQVGQGDIRPSTVVHIPAIDAVVAGDVVYNQIDAMLGLSGPSGWERWIQSVDAIEKLSPRMIVCGHRKPESSDREVTRMLDETRSYIIDFAHGAQTLGSAEELIRLMKSKYPDFGNPGRCISRRNPGSRESRREAPGAIRVERKDYAAHKNPHRRRNHPAGLPTLARHRRRHCSVRQAAAQALGG